MGYVPDRVVFSCIAGPRTQQHIQVPRLEKLRPGKRRPAYKRAEIQCYSLAEWGLVE
jgi:hypothetical protein